jgi:hypothetical protein
MQRNLSLHATAKITMSAVILGGNEYANHNVVKRYGLIVVADNKKRHSGQ